LNHQGPGAEFEADKKYQGANPICRSKLTDIARDARNRGVDGAGHKGFSGSEILDDWAGHLLIPLLSFLE
jgi:hypothetical protein